jgi:hypothetical protein
MQHTKWFCRGDSAKIAFIYGHAGSLDEANFKAAGRFGTQVDRRRGGHWRRAWQRAHAGRALARSVEGLLSKAFRPVARREEPVWQGCTAAPPSTTSTGGQPSAISYRYRQPGGGVLACPISRRAGCFRQGLCLFALAPFDRPTGLVHVPVRAPAAWLGDVMQRRGWLTAGGGRRVALGSVRQPCRLRNDACSCTQTQIVVPGGHRVASGTAGCWAAWYFYNADLLRFTWPSATLASARARRAEWECTLARTRTRRGARDARAGRPAPAWTCASPLNYARGRKVATHAVRSSRRQANPGSGH